MLYFALTTLIISAVINPSASHNLKRSDILPDVDIPIFGKQPLNTEFDRGMGIPLTTHLKKVGLIRDDPKKPEKETQVYRLTEQEEPALDVNLIPM